jgi:hypothetical protein
MSRPDSQQSQPALPSQKAQGPRRRHGGAFWVRSSIGPGSLGGGKGTRTPGLNAASVALSQLSYTPTGSGLGLYPLAEPSATSAETPGTAVLLHALDRRLFPQHVQPIELPGGRSEDVHNEIEVVQEDPLPTSPTLTTCR